MKYILSLLFSFTYLIIFSQNYIDVASFSYNNTPLNTFENSVEKTNIEEFGLLLNFPIVIDTKTTFLTGIIANKTTLKLDVGLSEETTLDAIGLKIGLNQRYSKWSATYMVIPKLASDFSGSLNSKDFQIGLFTLFSYHKKENLKYKFGLYTNTDKYGPLVVPLVGLYYKSLNDKFETNLTLPIQVDINYTILNKTKVGVDFNGLSTSYNLHKSFYGANDTYVVKVSNELFTYLQYKIKKSFYIKTKLGYAVGRNYKVFDADDKVDVSLASIYFGDDRTQLNTNFKNGAIFKFELLYRINF